MYVARAPSVAAVLLFAASPAVGQILRGTVLDSSSGRPVAGAHVIVLVDVRTTVGNVVTGADGVFAFRLPAVGAYQVRVSRLGYSPKMTEPIGVDSSFLTSVQLQLVPSAVPLDPLTVAAEHVVVEKQLPYLADAGVYDRRHKGFGHFLTRSDIEKRDPQLMTNALRGLSGVQVVCTGRRLPVRCDVLMPAAATMFFRGVCLPSVVLDGVALRVGGVGSPSATLDDLLNPFNIEAIEVYTSPAGVPVQYSGYMSPCGAIIAWSRR